MMDIKAIQEIFTNLDNLDKLDCLVIGVYCQLGDEHRNRLYDNYYNKCDSEDKQMLDGMNEKCRLINFFSYYSGKLSVRLLNSTDGLLQCKNASDIVNYIFR